VRESGVGERHHLVEVDGSPALDVLASHRIEVDSMGRTARDDPAFFLAAGAAGVLAARMARGQVSDPLANPR
jgi:hypothetical protein